MFSRLRGLAEQVTAPPESRFWAGARAGAKILACLVAAAELHTHARRLLGEMTGELVVMDDADLVEVETRAHRAGYAVGTQNAACRTWLEASQHYGVPVPEHVLREIKRLSESGQWQGEPVFVSAPGPFFPARHAPADDVDEAVTHDDDRPAPFWRTEAERLREQAADAG